MTPDLTDPVINFIAVTGTFVTMNIWFGIMVLLKDEGDSFKAMLIALAYMVIGMLI